jgi:Glycosyltransferases, probably involved in cell wall biogenesis
VTEAPEGAGAAELPESTTVEPTVDVIVPVHASARPVRRLAESVLTANEAPVRITFVCHNIEPERIAVSLGEFAADPRVRLLAFRDSTRSPAGPFNHGLDAATGAFVTKIDSDDALEKGAIDAWLHVQQRTGADVVMARMVVDETGAEIFTPPVRPKPLRPRASAGLDPVRDRLAYRTSVMGLVSRRVLDRARAIEGLESGEDIEQSLRLWFTTPTVVIADRAPAYRVHGGADDRVTGAARPIADEFAWLSRLESSPWFAALTDRERASIGLKLIRIHLFGAVANRGAEGLASADRETLADVALRLVRIAGDGIGALSIADARLLSLIRSGTAEPDALAAAAAARRRFTHPNALIAARATSTFGVGGPVRLAAAFWWAGRRGIRYLTAARRPRR